MGGFSASAFASSAFSSSSFEMDIGPPVVEYVPQDRWVPASGPAYSHSSAVVKRKRRGRRDELLLLRP